MFDRASVMSLVSLCFVTGLAGLSGFASGCSSSDSGDPTPADGGGDTAKVDTGAADTKVATDTAPAADTGPAVCWFIKATKSEELKCDECSDVKCKAEREECFGPGYLTGTYGGTCKDYITCQCACSEADATCQESCKITSTKDCQDCATKIDTCEKSKCATECDPPL